MIFSVPNGSDVNVGGSLWRDAAALHGADTGVRVRSRLLPMCPMFRCFST